MGVEVGDGALEHRGLARTGRADDHHQAVVAGDRPRRVGLAHIQPDHVHRRRRGGVGELGVGRPHHDLFLLGEDLFGGEVRGERIDPHRPAITPPRRRVVVCGVEVDAVFEDPVAGPLQRLRPTVS